MIYFARLATGSIKIGTTENMKARLRTLKNQYGNPVVLLKIMPGGPEEEAAIHERFADFRMGKTEQFRPTREIFEFVEVSIPANHNPDTVEQQPTTWDAARIQKALVLRLARSWSIVATANPA